MRVETGCCLLESGYEKGVEGAESADVVLSEEVEIELGGWAGVAEGCGGCFREDWCGGVGGLEIPLLQRQKV